MSTSPAPVPITPEPDGAAPVTEDLLERLIASPDFDAFYTTFPKDMDTERNLPVYLETLLSEHERTRIDVVHDAGLNETYGYQIFKGDRNPSRDKLLQICFGLHVSVREAQRLLWHGNVARLYPKDTRDAVLLFALSHGWNLSKTDGELYNMNLPTVQGS